MKEQAFVQTANVKRAMTEIKRLLNRPRHEMVGLGMIYGEPGLGNPDWPSRSAIARASSTSGWRPATQQRALPKSFGWG